jgi:hypothetical protein
MTIKKLQEKLVFNLCAVMTSEWTVIELHYENSMVDGDQRVVYKAFYFQGDEKIQFGVSAECHDCLYEMSDRQPDGVERWTWFELTIKNSGEYRCTFHYGTPPLLERQLALRGKYPDEPDDAKARNG